MSAPRTSVIVDGLEHPERIEACIKALHRSSDDIEVVVIVGEGADPAPADSWGDIVVVPSSTGAAKRANEAIAKTSSLEVALLSSSTTVFAGWLDPLRAAFCSSESVAAVSPRVVHDDPAWSQYERDDLDLQSEAFNHCDQASWASSLDLGRQCTLFWREALDGLGPFDESFETGLLYRSDWFLRAVRSGHKLLVCRDVIVRSSEPAFASFTAGSSSADMFDLERQLFSSTWGFDIGYSTTVREEVIALLGLPSADSRAHHRVDGQSEPVRVLEVGCAAGATLLEIANRFPGTELHGVELNAQAAEIASSFATVQALDVEKGLDYQRSYFDCIVLADVLEHLADPWTALSRLRRILKPDGTIVASIPNVMHVSVLRNLAGGRWTYEDAGILDRAHLRFFTLHEIEKLFAGAGFSKGAPQDYLYDIRSDSERFRARGAILRAAS